MPDERHMPEVDKLKRLRDDCNAHKGRLRKLIAEGKLDAAREVIDTILPLLTEAVEHTMDARGTIVQSFDDAFGEFAEGMQDHEDRLDALEGDVGVTILMPEDADTFRKVVGALRTMVELQLAQGTQPPEIEAKLKETLALCTTADAIIEQHTVSDEEEEDEEPDAETEPEADGATAPGGTA